MNKTFSVLFIARKPKNYVKGKLPVYLRLTIDGARTEFATKREVESDSWNKSMGRVLGKTESAKTLNHYFDLLQAKVFEAESDLLKAGLPVTIHTIGDKIQDKKTVIREKMILEVFQYHNDQFEELAKSGEFSYGTFKKFKSAYNSIGAFIHWKYNKADYPITRLNFQCMG
jgi:hypothetical protein